MIFRQLQIIQIDGQSTIFINGVKTVVIDGPIPHEFLYQHLIYHKQGDLFCRDVMMKEPPREVRSLRAKGLTLADIEELL